MSSSSSKPAPAHPAHLADTVQAIAEMHEAHHSRATPADRLVARITCLIARPGFMAWALALAIAWVAANIAARPLGRTAFDPAPFDLLQGILTLFALAATMLVLSTQRREDEIATQRDQVALQLAMLSDRKLGKVIALLEELRRDHPELRDRVDLVANQMTEPAAPGVMLDAMAATDLA